MKILSGKQPGPRKTLIQGMHGGGKSTLASRWRKPIFFDFENGLKDIDCQKTEPITDYLTVTSHMSWLGSNEHDFGTVVFDTADWLQSLVWKQTCLDHQVDSIEKVLGGYGKGYDEALKKWEHIIKGLEWLMTSKGMNVVILAHTKSVKIAPPGQDSYDQYQPDLHKSASALLQEWCDEVFFLTTKVFTRSEDLGFNKTRNIALGGDEWVLKSNSCAAYAAKRRVPLPDEMPRDSFIATYSQYFPQAGTTPLPTNGNITGVVTNGSSKKELANV